MIRLTTLLAGLCVCAATSVAQPVEGLVAVERAKALGLVGFDAFVDLRSEILHPSRYQTISYRADFQDLAAGSRSVPLAFGLSAILPGAGQFYNRQYVKAGVAVALEAAVITGYSILRTRGTGAEDAFQATAHQSWSPVKYASWLNDYATYLNEERGGNITAPLVQLPSSIDFTQPGSWSSSERAAVNAMFTQIRAVERQVFHPETGAAFSHQIPDFAAQQYYELIGKYFQFAPGWEDYSDWKNAQGEFTVAIDPEHTGSGGSKPNVSVSFYRYAGDHADAQDTLREASRISLLFVFNHLLAAIDAAVSSKLHNDRLDTSLGLSYDGPGRPTPVARLQFSF
ncbi:MAG: hypothetical protein O3B41_00845 [Bacteroidetes bacterium]|nr:hypothetical protein [Bacteroidota bacterium]